MKTYPKISLGIFPTPLYKLDNISRELGTNVWIKRDDMTGVGLGGNKVRKLEYLLAEAKQQGYELVMTTGGAQSNHAMLTAACALRLGMEPILVLKKRGVCTRRGNQVLNYLMGVDVRFVDTDSYDDIYEEMDRIAREEKHKPVYKIPCGGSNALGALGYVDCMKEIAEQGQHFDHVVCACGSGGTADGVFLGGALYMPDTKITAAMVDTDPFDKIVPELMHGTAELLGIADRPLPEIELVDMCGPGYAIPSQEGNEAIALMAHNEGIVLDTCYTGKTFAALVKMAREGRFKKDDNVLFIHTGGAGGLFAPDWEHM
jgi:D-cysteine desulfhydrase family pyridoxal phosphate-dependent enzyme